MLKIADIIKNLEKFRSNEATAARVTYIIARLKVINDLPRATITSFLSNIRRFQNNESLNVTIETLSFKEIITNTIAEVEAILKTKLADSPSYSNKQAKSLSSVNYIAPLKYNYITDNSMLEYEAALSRAKEINPPNPEINNALLEIALNKARLKSSTKSLDQKSKNLPNEKPTVSGVSSFGDSSSPFSTNQQKTDTPSLEAQVQAKLNQILGEIELSGNFASLHNSWHVLRFTSKLSAEKLNQCMDSLSHYGLSIKVAASFSGTIIDIEGKLTEVLEKITSQTSSDLSLG